MYPWYLVACAWYYGIPVPGTAIYVPFERHIYILALKKREAMPHKGRRDTGASCCGHLPLGALRQRLVTSLLSDKHARFKFCLYYTHPGGVHLLIVSVIEKHVSWYIWHARSPRFSSLCDGGGFDRFFRHFYLVLVYDAGRKYKDRWDIKMPSGPHIIYGQSINSIMHHSSCTTLDGNVNYFYLLRGTIVNRTKYCYKNR